MWTDGMRNAECCSGERAKKGPTQLTALISTGFHLGTAAQNTSHGSALNKQAVKMQAACWPVACCGAGAAQSVW